MTRPSKKQIKAHDEAVAIIEATKAAQLATPAGQPIPEATPAEIEFVLANWSPIVASAGNQSKNQAFFTPVGVATSLMCAMSPERNRRMVDICAGIGHLCYALAQWTGYHDRHSLQLWAVEINPEYVEVGKILMPWVNWVCADALDLATWQGLPRFQDAMSNPPFGHINTLADTDWLSFQGPAGLMMVEVGLKVSECGVTAILPQMQTPYRFSGRRDNRQSVYHETTPAIVERFRSLMPCDLEWGIWCEDMSDYRKDWLGAAPQIEICNITSIDMWYQLVGAMEVAHV